MPRNADVKRAIEGIDFTGDVDVDRPKVELLDRLIAEGARGRDEFSEAVYADFVNLGLVLAVADSQNIFGGDDQAAVDFLVDDDSQGADTNRAALIRLAATQGQFIRNLSSISRVANDARIRAVAEAGTAADLHAIFDAHIPGITDAQCLRLKQAARDKITGFRLAEQLALIGGYTDAHLAELQRLKAPPTPAALRAHLMATNPDFGHLTDAQANQITAAVQNKLVALRAAMGPRQTAIMDAQPFLIDTEAAVAQALADRDAANVAKGATEAILNGSEHVLRGRAVTPDQRRLHAEYETAHRLAEDAAATAETEYQVAVKALADARAALAKAGDALTSEADAIAAANSVAGLKDQAVAARAHVGEAKTAAEQYLESARNPDAPANQLARGNIFIEKNGVFGFKDQIVRKGEAAPVAAAAGAHALAIGFVGAAGGAPTFRNEKLKDGDTIHAMQKFDDTHAVIHLVQDHTRKVTSKSNMAAASDEQKAIEAIKAAKMLLTNYDADIGEALYIRGGTPEQAMRVYAALLLVAKNTDIALELADIEVRVIGWDGDPGWAAKNYEWGKERFINQQLGKELRHSPVVQDELADVAGLIEKQTMLKDDYQNSRAAGRAVNPKDEAPVGLEHRGRGPGVR